MPSVPDASLPCLIIWEAFRIDTPVWLGSKYGRTALAAGGLLCGGGTDRLAGAVCGGQTVRLTGVLLTSDIAAIKGAVLQIAAACNPFITKESRPW